MRGLQNLMERAVLLCEGKAITPAHFLLDSDEGSLFDEVEPQTGDCGTGSGDTIETHQASASSEADAAAGSLHPGQPEDASGRLFSDGVLPLSEMERIMIKKGLEQTSGNRTQAAELLGISVRTLRNKLNEYRLAGFEIE